MFFGVAFAHHAGADALVREGREAHPGGAGGGDDAGAVAAGHAPDPALRHRPALDPGAVPDLLDRRLPRGADDQDVGARGGVGRRQPGRRAARLREALHPRDAGAAHQRARLRGDHADPDRHRARAGHHRLARRGLDDRHQQDAAADPALVPALSRRVLGQRGLPGARRQPRLARGRALRGAHARDGDRGGRARGARRRASSRRATSRWATTASACRSCGPTRATTSTTRRSSRSSRSA